MADRTSLDSTHPDNEDSEMAPLNPTTTTVEDLDLGASRTPITDLTEPYRLYKRRFFGLFQIVLLNIIVSWDVCQSIYQA